MTPTLPTVNIRESHLECKLAVQSKCGTRFKKGGKTARCCMSDSKVWQTTGRVCARMCVFTSENWQGNRGVGFLFVLSLVDTTKIIK